MGNGEGSMEAREFLASKWTIGDDQQSSTVNTILQLSTQFAGNLLTNESSGTVS